MGGPVQGAVPAARGAGGRSRQDRRGNSSVGRCHPLGADLLVLPESAVGPSGPGPAQRVVRLRGRSSQSLGFCHSFLKPTKEEHEGADAPCLTNKEFRRTMKRIGLIVAAAMLGTTGVASAGMAVHQFAASTSTSSA